jgi:hypothetical protein
MRELRSFGSVRGEGSDVLAYWENRPSRDIRASPQQPFRIAEADVASGRSR